MFLFKADRYKAQRDEMQRLGSFSAVAFVFFHHDQLAVVMTLTGTQVNSKETIYSVGLWSVK
jgi:hypothetical protein